MRAAVLCGLLALAAATPAMAANGSAPATDAATARYTPAFDKCLATPEGQSTLGSIDCANAELAIQDVALNTAYRKAMKDLTPGQKAKLQAAQRAWIAFRDAECASYQDEDWGTLSRVLAADCVLHMTVMRTIDLENYPPGT